MASKAEPIAAESKPTAQATATLPKVTITYCTQCKWLLRAAYFAQELLSTFDGILGEVALRPTAGGVFNVTVLHGPVGDVADGAPASDVVQFPQEVLVWDRKAEGGFPETKVLKQRVRDVVQPTRYLGHSDKVGKKVVPAREECADCG